MLEGEREVRLPDLVNEVERLRDRGARFITATCLNTPNDQFEVIYHFELAPELIHLRLPLPRGESLPSISGVYFPAFLIENEIKDLFGLEITGIAIDFGGHLFMVDDREHPLDGEHDHEDGLTILVEERDGRGARS